MEDDYPIGKVIRKINKDVVRAFKDKLRREFKKHNKKWLIEQLICQALDKHCLQKWNGKLLQKDRDRQRSGRLSRLKKMQLNATKLVRFIKRYEKYSRDRLKEEGHLLNPPSKGTHLITPQYRSKKGESLLVKAKDILFGILFGDKKTCVDFDRVENVLLTVILPRFKAQVIDFMQASTKIKALGSWKDPDGVSSDDDAENILLQVEYGEVANRYISAGIMVTLNLINYLEVNDQMVYARMIHVDRSSLTI